MVSAKFGRLRSGLILTAGLVFISLGRAYPSADSAAPMQTEGPDLNTIAGTVRSLSVITSISQHAAVGRLTGVGVANAIPAALMKDNVRALTQATTLWTPGLRREQPNGYVLAGAQTQITYE